LMTWNQEYQYSSVGLLMKHAIKLSAMKEMFDKPEFWPTFQGNGTG